MIKCVVWDLDGTLWEGVLREGPVVLREDACALVRKLDGLGILQSVASKNAPDSALSQLERFGLLPYFVFPQIHLGDKPDSLRAIAESLNISMDSLAFVDDSPYERYQVQSYLPRVPVFSPEELEDLEQLVERENQGMTPSPHRPLIRLREARLQAERRFTGTREEFLATCNMELAVRPARPGDAPRVHELAMRTNKLNNLRERPSLAHVEGLIRGEAQVYACQLTDRFGDHGLVGTCVVYPGDPAELGLFCISCRVEGRGVGAAFLGCVLDGVFASPSAPSAVWCRYRINREDPSAALLLKLLGFAPVERAGDDVRYSLPREAKRPAPPGWIAVKTKGEMP